MPDESRPDVCHLHVSGSNSQETHKYTGSLQPCEKYVLIYEPETKSFLLDKITTEFNFNLRSTPMNKSAKALASQYPQLETSAPDASSSEDEMLDREEEAADPDNPYDWRHFIKQVRKSAAESVEMPRRSLTPPIAMPVRRPSRPKNKQRPYSRPQARQPTPSPPKEEADADNEDSSLDTDAEGEVDEDNGGLTIEIESIPKPRHQLGPAFPRVHGDGPVSLRSAATSVSPMGDPNESEEESDEDADIVEDVKLPSPMRYNQVPEEDDVDMDGDEEGDEGDLEAELERELGKHVDAEEEDDGGVVVEQGRYIDESSSESEEE